MRSYLYDLFAGMMPFFYTKRAMMLSDAPEAFTRRDPEKRGVLRHNSLYYFAKNTMRNGQLMAYTCTLSQSQERQAVFIDLPIDATAKAICPDFSLSNLHVSIDESYIKNTSLYAHAALTASHVTMTFDNRQSRMRTKVWVYVDDRGEVDLNAIRAETHRVDAAGSDKTAVLLNAMQRQVVLSQASKGMLLLKTLQDKKTERYLALEAESYKLERQLSLQLDTNDPAVMDTTNRLISLTEELTQYSDTKIDGRRAYLMEFISRRQIPLEPPRPSVETTEDESTSTEAPTAVAVCTAEPSRDVIETTVLKAQIQQLADQIETIEGERLEAPCSITDSMIRREPFLRKLRERCLCLLEIDPSSTAFVRTQEARVTQPPLDDYFLDHVLHGDLETVRLLFATVQQYVDMQPLYERLAIAIEKKTNVERHNQQIRVADFFYESSQSFREYSVVRERLFSSNFIFLWNNLITYVLNDDLPGFEMALRHGFNMGVGLIYQTKVFNALSSVILFYNKPEHLHFVNALLAHNTSLELKKVFRVSPEAGRGRKGKKLEKMLGVSTIKSSNFFSKSHDAHEEVRFSQYYECNEALTLAIMHHGYTFPELVNVLAQYTPIETLLLEITKMTSSRFWITRFCFPSLAGQVSQVFPNQEKANESFQALDQTKRVVKPTFSFYLAPSSPDTYFKQAHLLLERTKTVFLSLTSEEQRAVMKQLTTRAFELEGSVAQAKDWEPIMHCYMSVQMAYSLMHERNQQDDRLFLNISVRAMEAYKNQDTFKTYEALPRFARVVCTFLIGIPDNVQFMELLQSPLGRKVYAMMNADQQHDIDERLQFLASDCIEKTMALLLNPLCGVQYACPKYKQFNGLMWPNEADLNHQRAACSEAEARQGMSFEFYITNPSHSDASEFFTQAQKTLERSKAIVSMLSDEVKATQMQNLCQRVMYEENPEEEERYYLSALLAYTWMLNPALRFKKLVLDLLVVLAENSVVLHRTAASTQRFYNLAAHVLSELSESELANVSPRSMSEIRAHASPAILEKTGGRSGPSPR